MTQTQTPLHAYDVLVVGAGFAGGVVARDLAEAGQTVCVLERRRHIGGNAFDELDEAGILIHRYGPHIFHTKDQRVFDYLSRFTKWRDYEHRVLGNIHGTLMPIPFNRTSMSIAFGERQGEELYELLSRKFGEGVKVPISELRELDDPELEDVADYIYENIFLGYTLKQWGVTPEELDPAVTGRVPVLISDDDRYFQDSHQGMPAEGYSALFECLLDHPGIDVRLGVDALDRMVVEKDGVILGGHPYDGLVIYTGPIDELFGHVAGDLPYRSLDLRMETLPVDSFQPVATVNYPVSEEFTRITEFKKLTGQELEGRTTILREYPVAYDRAAGLDPYYPIANPTNEELYGRYQDLAAEVPNLHLLGRLAEYRYYDMDAAVAAALELSDRLLGREETA